MQNTSSNLWPLMDLWPIKVKPNFWCSTKKTKLAECFPVSQTARLQSTKLLGVFIEECQEWEEQLRRLNNILNSKLFIIRRIARKIPVQNHEHCPQLMGKQTQVWSPAMLQSETYQFGSYPSLFEIPSNESKQNAEGNQRIKNQ